MGTTCRQLGQNNLAKMEVKMNRLFPTELSRKTIGFDELWDKAMQTTSGFPPYNIEKNSDDQFAITLAVAGFSKDELTVTLDNSSLTVAGEKRVEKSTAKYLFQGIGLRNFRREFFLDSFIEVDEVSLDNGLLRINLVRKIPDAMKPKVIAIR